MPLLAFVFWATFTVADDQKILSQKDCNEIKDGVLYLLTFAVQNLKALETKPEGTPNFVEHTAKIEWAVNMAANYKTFNKVFFDKE